MNSRETKNQKRLRLIHETVQTYMDLNQMIQSSAVNHWLMHELTFAQARALIIISGRQAMTISQLAGSLGIGNPTASLLVQQLVERGLVTRSEGEHDRRQTFVRLSEKGAEIGLGRRKERERQWQTWLSHLSDDELSALARGLSALQEVVKTEVEQILQPSESNASGAEIEKARSKS